MIDLMLSGQLFVAALFLGSVYSLAAVGLNLVYGTMRLLNVAHGDLIMLGAYAGYIGFSWFDLSPFLTMFLSAIGCAALGLIVYIVLVRRIVESMDSQQLEANSLLIFFGLSVIFQNTVSLVFSTESRAYQYMNSTVDYGFFSLSEARSVILLISISICIAIIIFLRNSTFGLSMSALIQNRVAASIVGVNVAKVQVVSFVTGFALAGFCGTLISMTIQSQPYIGFTYTIAAFLVIILGGLGNIRGGIIAGFALAFLEIYCTTLISQNARSILLYGLFVLILIVKPHGLIGRSSS